MSTVCMLSTNLVVMDAHLAQMMNVAVLHETNLKLGGWNIQSSSVMKNVNGRMKTVIF